MSDVERKNRSRGNKTEIIHKEWNMKENIWLWRDIFAASSLLKQRLDINNNERSGKNENVLVPDVCVARSSVPAWWTIHPHTIFVLFISTHLVTTRPEPICRSNSQIPGKVWWHSEDILMWLLAQHSTSERGTDVQPITKPKPAPRRYRFQVGNDIGTMCTQIRWVLMNFIFFDEFHINRVSNRGLGDKGTYPYLLSHMGYPSGSWLLF
jgi:hypothetical protein